MASFVEIPQLSEEISYHVEEVLTDGQRTDGRMDDPKTQDSRRLLLAAELAKIVFPESGA